MGKSYVQHAYERMWPFCFCDETVEADDDDDVVVEVGGVWLLLLLWFDSVVCDFCDRFGLLPLLAELFVFIAVALYCVAWRFGIDGVTYEL